MRIAFLTSSDPRDKRSWSGIYYYMARALEKHCGEVSYLGPLWLWQRAAGWLCHGVARTLLKGSYDYIHTPSLAKRYAKIFARKISERPVDVIFAPAASTEVASLDVRIPIIYLSDTTFALIKDYYSSFSNLFEASIRNGHSIERAAIGRASLIVYPSDWAARSATKDYGAEPAKVHVIPFGANLEEAPPPQIVLQKRRADRCRLLFVGVQWARKGGDIAFETMVKLQEMGIQAELTVCGCVPPGRSIDETVKVIRFLDKNDAAQAKRLAELYMASDFLLLPTRNECFGIVFCEANAYGLPAIATDTGGVSGAIRNGENGFMLPVSAGGSEYATLIASLWRDEDVYWNMVRSSRAAFDQRLNWDAWGRRMEALMAGLC